MSIWTKISDECDQYLVEFMPQGLKAVLMAKECPAWYQQDAPNTLANKHSDSQI